MPLPLVLPRASSTPTAPCAPAGRRSRTGLLHDKVTNASSPARSGSRYGWIIRTGGSCGSRPSRDHHHHPRPLDGKPTSAALKSSACGRLQVARPLVSPAEVYPRDLTSRMCRLRPHSPRVIAVSSAPGRTNPCYSLRRWMLFDTDSSTGPHGGAERVGWVWKQVATSAPSLTASWLPKHQRV